MLSNIIVSSWSDTNPATSLSSIDYASVLKLSFGGGEYEREGVARVDYRNYPFRQEKYGKALIILGSCNGLICLGVFKGSSCDLRKNHPIYIWNPSTKEYKEIPECKFSSNKFKVKYGFGYDNDIDDYKMVRISDGENHGCLDIQVYTLGSDSWHHVLTISCSFSSDSTFFSVLFNGSLHWLGVTSSEVIFAFEICKERLVHLMLPEKTTEGWEEEDENAIKVVGVLGDCICFSIWPGQYMGHAGLWRTKFMD
ncbi:F-box/kelch-repeat protein At3g06240-like [Papaver somniferum]|uniref:F-box/kelch-repeat protein At3g06240-like n=1 Tax=Papaver somniferum TaxID=3469 RepID=UPI000E7020AE|nr:F-box/kelch-repeat protein At3g06240-like [Papaver somniferum]